jgi:CubicO group peptidase (beta-lactamase class C family)
VENPVKETSLVFRLVWPVLVLLLSVSGCVADKPFKFPSTIVPEQLDDGWDVASPVDVGISQAALDEIYAMFLSEDRYYNAKSLLVVKDSKLVFEAYCRTPADRDTYGHIQSVTKSITSLVFGIVQTTGAVDSLEQPLYSIIPEKFPADEAKHSITLRHLLTMSSGLAFDDDDFSVEIYANKPDDPIRYILNKPLYDQPGASFYYRDCDPHLLSFAIWRLTGQTEEQWAAERLFAPLEIGDYYWDTDHTGTTMGAHGLHLKPRDLAKIGQLVLDFGRWRGNQVVDSAWIATSTGKQVETGYSSGPEMRHYGYYWWVLPYWQAIEAWGHGGNYILIQPKHNIVIVLTSLPDADNDIVATRPEQFHELIRPLLDSE